MSSETTLWGASLPPEVEPAPAPEKPAENVNPCVTLFGPGPEGRICRDCVYLHGFQQSATWYKCEKRKWKAKSGKNQGTIYPGGDHRVRWPACAKFQEREEKQDD